MTASPTRIGRYEIVRRLGRSMTDVYLAIDTVENRKAALKLVKSSGDSVTKLVLEAERRGAAIQREMHALDPRVVEIYDFGDIDGYFFVAMQYVEGRNLAEVLQAQQTIDANRAAVIALEICEQLAKFHSWQSTVVHGDIKPSNIHIGANDTVRLLDFGIAKTLRADRDATAHNFGSPGYCSPERLQRSEVDQQSDLWAVGATLYEMLAGAPPYQAEDTRKLEALIRSKRPPRALSGSVPKPLRLIVSKALARAEARRYRSAMEFLVDLQAFLGNRPTLAEMERRGWNPNATIEAACDVLRRATHTVRRAGRRWKLVGAFGWFAAGMALWIGTAFVWQSWQTLHAERAPAEAAARNREQIKKAALKEAPREATIKPNPPPRIDWPAKYVAEADEIFDAYRVGSDPALRHFDWRMAEIRLQDAVEQGLADDETKGKLALAKGYAALERLSVGLYSDKEAAATRVEARRDFDEAERSMPQSADAHLAMARLYVYSMPDLAKARAEFAAAEKLGAKFGPREIEEQADACRIRAQQLASSNPREAWNAAQQARALYRRVAGFDRADEHLNELARIHQPGAKKFVGQAFKPTAGLSPGASQQKGSVHRSRRWQ
jgi:eukaryotic-like serine/threonine-protein kinase